MNTIETITADEFHKLNDIVANHNRYYDWILRYLSYTSFEDKTEISLRLEGWNNLHGKDRSYCTFTFTNPDEFVFNEVRTRFSVVSQGVSCMSENGLLFLSIIPMSDDPVSLDEFRESLVYIAGATVRIERGICQK